MRLFSRRRGPTWVSSCCRVSASPRQHAPADCPAVVGGGDRASRPAHSRTPSGDVCIDHGKWKEGRALGPGLPQSRHAAIPPGGSHNVRTRGDRHKAAARPWVPRWTVRNAPHARRHVAVGRHAAHASRPARRGLAAKDHVSGGAPGARHPCRGPGGPRGRDSDAEDIRLILPVVICLS